MTDSNKQLPATVDQPQPPRPRIWPLWLIAVLALAVSLALAFAGYLLWLQQQSMQDRLSSVIQTAERLQNNYSQTDNQRAERLQALDSRINELREKIATQQRQIDHNARELLEAGNRTRTDWLLSEAEYLLRIANQRLQIEQDYKGALAVLQAADQVLAETDDVGVYPVREQLAREIMALKSIAGVDRTGLYLQLEAAIETVQSLSDSALAGNDPAPAPTATGEDGGGQSQGAVARAWQETRETLASMIVVRRLDEPVKPLLSPEQSAYARLNIQLMLEEAELGLLERNQIVYQQALGKALDAIKRWYDNSDPRVEALLGTLSELRQKSIDPELPDISKSLELLKARLEGRTDPAANRDDDGQAESAAPTSDNGDAGS